jgi:hypothetical protein
LSTCGIRTQPATSTCRVMESQLKINCFAAQFGSQICFQHAEIWPCFGRLKIKEWLREKHPEHGQLSSSFKGFGELCRDLLGLDRKRCRLVSRLLTGHCALRQHLHVMGILESVASGKCGQEEESSCHGKVGGAQWTQWWSECMGKLEVVPPQVYHTSTIVQ